MKITKRVILARIRRKLKKDRKALKACNYHSAWHYTVGDYYIINKDNDITNTHQDLISLSKELKVLKEFEEFDQQN